MPVLIASTEEVRFLFFFFLLGPPCDEGGGGTGGHGPWGNKLKILGQIQIIDYEFDLYFFFFY